MYITGKFLEVVEVSSVDGIEPNSESCVAMAFMPLDAVDVSLVVLMPAASNGVISEKLFLLRFGHGYQHGKSRSMINKKASRFIASLGKVLATSLANIRDQNVVNAVWSALEGKYGIPGGVSYNLPKLDGPIWRGNKDGSTGNPVHRWRVSVRREKRPLMGFANGRNVVESPSNRNGRGPTQIEPFCAVVSAGAALQESVEHIQPMSYFIEPGPECWDRTSGLGCERPR